MFKEREVTARECTNVSDGPRKEVSIPHVEKKMLRTGFMEV